MNTSTANSSKEPYLRTTTCIWENWERISREPQRIRSSIMETAAPVSTRKLDFLPRILSVIVSDLKLVKSWVRTDKVTLE